MVLSGEAIKKGVQSNIISLEPYDEASIETAHINLHLGETDLVFEGDTVSLPPKAFVLARTLEKVTLPSHICGLVEGRAKLAQMGLSVEQSSKFVEPNTANTLTLEMFNASDEPIQLTIGQKIAKLILLRVVDEI